MPMTCLIHTANESWLQPTSQEVMEPKPEKAMCNTRSLTLAGRLPTYTVVTGTATSPAAGSASLVFVCMHPMHTVSVRGFLTLETAWMQVSHASPNC